MRPRQALSRKKVRKRNLAGRLARLKASGSVPAPRTSKASGSVPAPRAPRTSVAGWAEDILQYVAIYASTSGPVTALLSPETPRPSRRCAQRFGERNVDGVRRLHQHRLVVVAAALLQHIRALLVNSREIDRHWRSDRLMLVRRLVFVSPIINPVSLYAGVAVKISFENIQPTPLIITRIDARRTHRKMQITCGLVNELRINANKATLQNATIDGI